MRWALNYPPPAAAAFPKYARADGTSPFKDALVTPPYPPLPETPPPGGVPD
ncbi:hypothetical protein GCM10010211_20100 [Streptomyces albospinus]|uniref:Uncharacterized protein n=1 Tax=Streptomyces albospinus TaxID=285515 RepID=A0ABQ2UV05_9ACTN|nr:hypothetical protein GCM10010211_20100 [Streptomyces albospinus]